MNSKKIITIEQFLDELVANSTKINYQSGIIKFIEVIYGRKKKNERRATNKEIEMYFESINQYMQENRDNIDKCSEDLKKFVLSMRDNVAPFTARSHLNAITVYFSENNIIIPRGTLKQIKRKMKKVDRATDEEDFEIEIISSILDHLDIKGKALTLMLVSTGMRISELLQIKEDDINFKNNPPMITVRPEVAKNGKRRYTFINEEAKKALLEWKKVKKNYLKTAFNRTKGFAEVYSHKKPKNIEDDRVFPFSRSVVDQMWKKAQSDAGVLSIDKKTNRIKLNIHGLRKFFISQLGLGCPKEIVEAIAAHEGYLSGAYRRYNKKQLGEYYQKHEKLLYISWSGENTQKLETELNSHTESIGELFIKNKELEEKNRELKNRVSVMEDDSKVAQYFLHCLIEKKQPDNLVFDPNINKLVFKDGS